MSINLDSLLRQLSDSANGPVPHDARTQFEQAAQGASPDALSAGLEDAFNSDRTPPFGQMVGQLFGHADPQQRNGILGTLLGALGGAANPALRRAGVEAIDPQQAATQMSPAQVEQVAQQAQAANPGIVGEMSRFYAQHLALVKSLGGMALALVLGRMHSTRH